MCSLWPTGNWELPVWPTCHWELPVWSLWPTGHSEMHVWPNVAVICLCGSQGAPVWPTVAFDFY